MPDSVTITREWVELLDGIADDGEFRKTLRAVLQFALDGKEPDGLSEIGKCVFMTIRRGIMERNRKRNYIAKRRKETSTVPSTVPSTLDAENVYSRRSDDLLDLSSNQHIDTINTPSCKSKDLLCSPKGEEKKKFAPPTLDDVIEYCKQRRNAVDAEQFHAFYSANNWMVGHGNKMKDWKAAVRYWERSMYMRRKKLTETRDYSGI